MFTVPATAKVIWRQLVSPPTDWRSWDQTRDPWVQGEWFIHYTTTAPVEVSWIKIENNNNKKNSLNIFHMKFCAKATQLSRL